VKEKPAIGHGLGCAQLIVAHANRALTWSQQPDNQLFWSLLDRGGRLFRQRSEQCTTASQTSAQRFRQLNGLPQTGQILLCRWLGGNPLPPGRAPGSPRRRDMIQSIVLAERRQTGRTGRLSITLSIRPYCTASDGDMKKSRSVSSSIRLRGWPVRSESSWFSFFFR